MTHSRPTGSFVALVTPMNEDGSIDFEGFRALIDWHAWQGTSALLLMGSTGEVSMLTPEERREIVRRTLAMRRPGISMWYGCTCGSTAATIDFVRHAEAEGADGAIIAAPAYICAPNADVVAYAEEVMDATDMACGFYNNPPRVGTDLHWDDLLRLAQHPNMAVLKESTTRAGQVAQVLAGAPDMAVMCCCSPNLGLVVPTMALGGHGTANMTGNLIPQEMAVVSKPWEGGEDAFACRAAWLEALPVLHFAYSAINPVAVKSLMRAVGLPSGPLRRPLRPLDGAALARGVEALRRTGAAERYGWRLDSAMAAE